MPRLLSSTPARAFPFTGVDASVFCGLVVAPPLSPVLQPDPIMSLKQVIGFSGDKKGCLLWSTSGEEVVFPCANTVVAMSLVDTPAAFAGSLSPLDYGEAPDTPASSPRRMRCRPQRHFIGHTDDVCCLALRYRHPTPTATAFLSFSNTAIVPTTLASRAHTLNAFCSSLP